MDAPTTKLLKRNNPTTGENLKVPNVVEQSIAVLEAHESRTSISQDRETHDVSIFANLSNIVRLTTTTKTTGEVGENQLAELESRPELFGSSSPLDYERKNKGTHVNTLSPIASDEHT